MALRKGAPGARLRLGPSVVLDGHGEQGAHGDAPQRAEGVHRRLPELLRHQPQPVAHDGGAPLRPVAAGQDRAPQQGDLSTVADPVHCPITDWEWTFTDASGLKSNAQNPAPVTYGNNSSHPVTLKVTNAGGSTTITKNS